MFISNSTLIGQASTLNNIGNIFFPSGGVTGTIPKAFNELWDIAMKGAMYTLVCNIGLTIAIFAVGFWCVKFYKVLQEGSLQPAVNEMVFPVILIILLSNGGANMRDLTLGTRNIMDGVNRSVNLVINAEVDFRTALEVLGDSSLLMNKIGLSLDQCKKKVALDEFELCMVTQGTIMKAFTQTFTDKWKRNNGSKWRTQLNDWETYYTQAATNPFKVTKPSDLTNQNGNTPATNTGTAAPNTGAATSQPVSLSTITGYDDTADLRRAILSFRTAFLYIVEVMMIVTGLVGPIFLALSMFPVGTKPLIAWGTSFLSLGFCKICFSLVSGLSAVAMIYSGPNVDMLVVSVVLGLLAPVIAFSIASGSGIAALTQVSYSAQNFGMNNGIAISPINGTPPAAVSSAQNHTPVKREGASQ
jgi:hypothetical protein